jgi:hypothetical protein
MIWTGVNMKMYSCSKYKGDKKSPLPQLLSAYKRKERGLRGASNTLSPRVSGDDGLKALP